MTDSPSVTWPSPAMTTLSSRRTQRTVVERIRRRAGVSAVLSVAAATSGFLIMSAILDYTARLDGETGAPRLCRKYCAVPPELDFVPLLLPGTDIPSFPVSPLRGWSNSAAHFFAGLGVATQTRPARPARLGTLNPNPAILGRSARQSRTYRIVEHVFNLGAQVLFAAESSIKRLFLPDTSDVPCFFTDPVCRNAFEFLHDLWNAESPVLVLPRR